MKAIFFFYISCNWWPVWSELFSLMFTRADCMLSWLHPRLSLHVRCLWPDQRSAQTCVPARQGSGGVERSSSHRLRQLWLRQPPDVSLDAEYPGPTHEAQRRGNSHNCQLFVKGLPYFYSEKHNQTYNGFRRFAQLKNWMTRKEVLWVQVSIWIFVLNRPWYFGVVYQVYFVCIRCVCEWLYQCFVWDFFNFLTSQSPLFYFHLRNIFGRIKPSM